MVSAEWGDWLLVTPVYPLQRGHDEYPSATADRGRDVGFWEITAPLRGPGCFYDARPLVKTKIIFFSASVSSLPRGTERG
jgi:hypothetical protein